MSRGAEMTDVLRQKILKYSNWNYEEDQLEKKEDRLERRKFLSDFRRKIKAYNGSERIKVPLYTATRIVNKKKSKENFNSIWRQNIDYSINE